MRLFERSLHRRFAVRTLLILFLFSWLALSIDLTRELGTSRGGGYADDFRKSLTRHVRALEIAVAIAAPLALVLVLQTLRRRGILVVAFAAGLPPARLRRALLWMALGTAVASAALQEAASLTYGPEADEVVPELFTVDGMHIWCRRPPGETEVLDRVHVFRNEDLDVSSSPGAKWSAEANAFLLEPMTRKAGALVAMDRFTPPEGKRRPLVPRSFRSVFGPAASLRGILAALNRVGVGPLLLLLVGYVTLLTPATRPWKPYLIFLFLVPAVGLGTVTTTLLLWRGSPAALVVECVWVLACLAVLVVLDRRFRNRGLRI